MDDLDLSRYRRDDRDRRGVDRPGLRYRPFLGRVTTAAPAAGKFLKVIPLGLLGNESEGSTGSTSDLGTDPILAYVPAGGGVPRTNDEVIVRRVDHRWVIKSRPASTTGVGYCGCANVPLALSCTWHYSGQNYTFPLTYSSSSPTFNCGPGNPSLINTDNGGWFSDCVTTTAGTVLAARFFFYCVGGANKFAMAAQFYQATSGGTASPYIYAGSCPQSGPYCNPYSGLGSSATVSCSPFSWSYSPAILYGGWTVTP